MKHHNKGPLLKRLPDLLLEAAGWLAGKGQRVGWLTVFVTQNFVWLFFDMVEWPGRGLVEQCS